MNADRYQTEFQKPLEHFQHELAGLRTGRATPSLLEDLRAEYYGTPTPLNQLATITAPDSMMLLVQAWDASAVPEIEKAIRASNLGLNPAVDGQIVRVPFPQPTEERRHELVKLAKQKAESARISIRSIREEAMKAIKEQETAGDLSEDGADNARKMLQKAVDTANDEVQSLFEKKQKEIMTLSAC